MLLPLIRDKVCTHDNLHVAGDRFYLPAFVCYNGVYCSTASTSSVASSLTNRNSPKEKRQANSPLPKPPDITADDMYAKVLKKRRNENDRCSSRDSVYHSDPDSASSLNFHTGPSNSGELAVLLKLEHRDVEKSDRELGEDEDDPDRYACGYETLPERKYVVICCIKI